MPKKRKSQTKRRAGGGVAEQTFQQVEELVAKTNVTKSAAFKEVARKTRRTPGTVAVTYYRVAQRKRGGEVGPIGRRRSVEGLLARASQVIKDLGEVVDRQQQEIARLRKEAAWAEKVRRALRRA